MKNNTNKSFEEFTFIPNENDKEFLKSFIKHIKEFDKIGYFHNEVDKKDFPNYKKVVKKPMSFEKIEKKFFKKEKNNFKKFFEDVALIWENCRLYNLDNSEIHTFSFKIEEVAKNYLEKNYKKEGKEKEENSNNNTDITDNTNKDKEDDSKKIEKKFLEEKENEKLEEAINIKVPKKRGRKPKIFYEEKAKLFDLDKKVEELKNTNEENKHKKINSAFTICNKNNLMEKELKIISDTKKKKEEDFDIEENNKLSDDTYSYEIKSKKSKKKDTKILKVKTLNSKEIDFNNTYVIHSNINLTKEDDLTKKPINSISKINFIEEKEENKTRNSKNALVKLVDQNDEENEIFYKEIVGQIPVETFRNEFVTGEEIKNMLLMIGQIDRKTMFEIISILNDRYNYCIKENEDIYHIQFGAFKRESFDCVIK